MALGSEVQEYDDSDMYMEPDESKEPPQVDHIEATTEKDDHDETSTIVANTSDKEASEQTEKSDETNDQETKNTQDTVVTQITGADGRTLQAESQNFFPSFAELFANRFPYTEQQQRYRPNRFLSYFQRDRNGYQTAATGVKDTQPSLLGSGNFGVIRGGTYYPEDRETDDYTVHESVYNPYYQNRGRAQYYKNPKPQQFRGSDFFANFRDFADITAPPKSSFSHLSVVYANKNSSSTGHATEPRNIIETLRMLEEEDQSNSEEITTTETPRKKLSKGKWKLMKMKQYEEEKARRSRTSVEPLLALS